MLSIILKGDFRYFYPENIIDFASLPSAWDASLNTGIGKSALSSLWINSYLNFTAAFIKLGLSWDTIGLILWILPPIILSFLSAYYLFKTLFPDSKRFRFLAGFVYLTNTYFLMLFIGGQMGVALAYSIAPFVLAKFIKIIRTSDLRLKTSVLAGLVLALQVLFDPRIAYVTVVIILVFLFLKLSILSSIVTFKFLLPFIIAVLLHSYWIIPLIITRQSALPEGYDTIAGFQFFSFADFSHALSLLHPNWPENIFGKVYFLQPEFLILPILAYTSLLFLDLRRKTEDLRNRTILFFSLLALLGAFLAKGANPPFGEINSFLFQHFPGMNMFRDPTKWYMLVALSYSILIPYSLFNLVTWINSKFKMQNSKLQFKISNVIFLFTTTLAWQALLILYLLFLIRPLYMSELRDKFKPKEIPQEYVQLKNFLVSQPEFFRTLWIPEWQRYGFFSNNHPAIGRYEILKQASASGQIEELKKESMQELLEDLSVKYIIVPYDNEGEIFLEDRKYSEEKRQEAEQELDKISWLNKVRLNDLNHLIRIAVYEIKGNKDRFWSPTDFGISYSFISSTEYKVEVKNAKKSDLLVFSENFDKNWRAQINEFQINTESYKGFLNSFILPKEGNYSFKVYYAPQKWVNIGLLISGATLLTTLRVLIFRRPRKR